MAPPLLAVGETHLYTAIGVREGSDYLLAQERASPRLARIGCNIGCNALPPAIDVHCGLCGGWIYRRLTRYLVHPPQQPHISYELHTDASMLMARGPT